jgi:DNA-binding LytR/AlgR family response regulator
MRSWVLAVVVGFAGCGPIVYVNEVTRRAANAVDEARAAEADKYSPYYWTRANEYLRKARELAAHADMQEANRYGRLSSEAAELALEEATKAKAAPKRTPTAPAKDDKDIVPAPAKETL